MAVDAPADEVDYRKRLGPASFNLIAASEDWMRFCAMASLDGLICRRGPRDRRKLARAGGSRAFIA